MTNTVVLNNEQHKDLKIDPRHCAEYGDNVNRTVVFSTEFGELHKEYPILFYKDPEQNSYQAHVILGLERDENLFLSDNQWSGNYVPAVLARGPFLIGFQNQNIQGEQRTEPVILVDMDNPRVGAEQGEPAFLQFGGDSPYLNKIKRTLKIIHDGAAFDKTLLTCLESMDLLEPVAIEVKLSDSEQFNFRDYYTINEEKLSNLDGESLVKLNKLGVLKLAFYVASSLSNFHRLIERKNRVAAKAR